MGNVWHTATLSLFSTYKYPICYLRQSVRPQCYSLSSCKGRLIFSSLNSFWHFHIGSGDTLSILWFCTRRSASFAPLWYWYSLARSLPNWDFSGTASFAHSVQKTKKLGWMRFVLYQHLSSSYSQLVQFYRGQAEVYDSTRDVLLRGRDTMLSLSVAHLHHLREASPKRRFVWVDIGGGTGRVIH